MEGVKTAAPYLSDSRSSAAFARIAENMVEQQCSQALPYPTLQIIIYALYQSLVYRLSERGAVMPIDRDVARGSAGEAFPPPQPALAQGILEVRPQAEADGRSCGYSWSLFRKYLRRFFSSFQFKLSRLRFATFHLAGGFLSR